MSIYTSLTIGRAKAMEVVLAKLATTTNEELKRFVFAAMECDPLNHYNVYMVVDGAGEDDDKVTV